MKRSELKKAQHENKVLRNMVTALKDALDEVGKAADEAIVVTMEIKEGSRGKWWANGYIPQAKRRRVFGGAPFNSREELVNTIQSLQGCKFKIVEKD
ncbi:hypothetical protein [Candidatus Poriferisocius sp.]|uniref:hypothetical protein n=1 Tax=Candidatus Poriferisocius sp. TaxID=3101276 RepID=UPI003B5233A9